jgi:hypothetical protein
VRVVVAAMLLMTTSWLVSGRLRGLESFTAESVSGPGGLREVDARYIRSAKKGDGE